MSKNRPKPPPAPPASPPVRPIVREKRSSGPNLFVRLLLSVVLAWHVVALFMAPLSIPPSSDLVVRIAQGPFGLPEDTPWYKRLSMQWYLDALYINHGYHFFAPEPGAGHIIRYQVTNEQGETIVAGQFPDASEYWPRLRYHRHFMLSDQAAGLVMRRDPQASEQLALEAYARHLLSEHGGAQARLTRIRHDMLSPREKQSGEKLDAPHKFETSLEVVWPPPGGVRHSAANLDAQPWRTR